MIISVDPPISASGRKEIIGTQEESLVSSFPTNQSCTAKDAWRSSPCFTSSWVRVINRRQSCSNSACFDPPHPPLSAEGESYEEQSPNAAAMTDNDHFS